VALLRSSFRFVLFCGNIFVGNPGTLHTCIKPQTWRM